MTGNIWSRHLLSASPRGTVGLDTSNTKQQFPVICKMGGGGRWKQPDSMCYALFAKHESRKWVKLMWMAMFVGLFTCLSSRTAGLIFLWASTEEASWLSLQRLGFGQDNREIGVQFPARIRNFLFAASRPALGPSTLIFDGKRGLFPWVQSCCWI